MAEFALTHRFPTDFTGSPETAASAKAYFEEIGANLVSRTDPLAETRQLGDCGSRTEPRAHTIVTAKHAEAAMAMTGKWPLLHRGGGIEVRALTTRPIRLDMPAGANGIEQ